MERKSPGLKGEGSQTATSPATSEAAANSPNAEEIHVTAQKIEQRAIDMPITISALNGQRMRELGVSDLDELSR